MNRELLMVGERLLAIFWIGALWSIGYIAVPILFASLDDRMLAGMLAGKMFTSVSFIGLASALILLVSAWLGSQQPLRERRIWLLAGMLLLVVIGEFVLQPMMADLKLQGLEHEAVAARFGMLHGIASLFYLANSVAGLVLLVMLLRSGKGVLRGG